MSLFKPKIEYRVVEVEKPRTVPENDEADSTIANLQHHPGFLRLIAKLKNQRSLLETTLKRTRHADIREVDFLQSGIFWANWLEAETDKHVFNKPKSTPAPALEIEREAFERAQAMLDIVGDQDWQSQAATPEGLGA